MRKTSTKRALLTSVMALFLCFTMLVGTTFAWFTDSASSTGNKIVAGTLDLELQMYDGTKYVNIGDSEKPIFGDGSIAQNVNAETKWEPGKTQVAYLAIANKGNLDLKYTVKLNLKDSTKDLYKVMQYAITPDAMGTDAAAPAWTNGISVLPGVQDAPAVEVVLEEGATHYFALSLHMLDEAGNEYQGGTVTFDILVLATQLASEEDSFGKDYDDAAPMPGYSDPEYVAAPGGVYEDIVLNTSDETAFATVPAELAQKLADKNVTKVQLTAVAPSVETKENGDLDVSFGNVALLDQNGEEIDLTGNTVPVPVKLELGAAYAGKYATVFHDGVIVASGTVDADGFLSYTTVHFCEVSVLLSENAPVGDLVVDGEIVETLPEEIDPFTLVQMNKNGFYYTVSAGFANSWYEYPSVAGKIEADVYLPEDLIAFNMMYLNGALAETGSHSDLTIKADLDFAGYNWLPIARFYTNVHGEDHKISNLNDSFFGCVYDCQLFNVTLENVTASGSAAGVLGKELAGDMQIENVTIAGVNTVTYVADGLVNWPEEGIGVGAICGVSLIGCSAPAKVDVTITGTITVNYNGLVAGNNTNLENLGYDKLFGLNLYKVNAYSGNGVQLNGGKIVENGEYYTADNALIIYTLDELKAFAAEVNSGNTFRGKKVVLAADIDLMGEEWTPIGNSTNKFQGIFNGRGYTISNLVITGNKSDVGLFGMTTDGEIKNLTVENAKVSGYLDVGVVAGTPYTSKYTNITVKGHIEVNGFAYVGGVGGKNAYANWTDITVDVDETSYVKAYSVNSEGTAYRTYVGGVIGFCGEGGHKFTNVTSNVDVIGSTCDVGGITGIAHYGNSFINCSSSGDVTILAATDASDIEEIGGIAGVWMNATQDVTFDGCSFTGNLSVTLREGTDPTLIPDLSDNTITGKGYYAETTNNLIIK